jgi:hypothetical protein
MLMVSIYDSNPSKVVEAIELLDNELSQQSVRFKSGLDTKWRLDNELPVIHNQLVQHLKMYANDYHLAKMVEQFSDASELYEPYVKLVEQWIEQTANQYELTQSVVRAKVNIMLARIARQDKKVRYIRVGLGALSVACTMWMGFNIYQNIEVSQQKALIEQQLGQVNTTYHRVYSETLKSIPIKQSRGIWGLATYIAGYQDFPPDNLSKIEIPENLTQEQEEQLNKLKQAFQQRKIVLDESNRLGGKQSRIVATIILSGLMLLFVPLYGWMWIPNNRNIRYQRL